MTTYKFIQISDMTYDKQTIVNRCGDLGFKFIEHFEKIYSNPNDNAVDHWIGELSGWFKQVSRLKFKSNHKLINNEQLIEWFFLDGSDLDGLFGNDNLKKNKYKLFIEELLTSKDVKYSLIKANIINNR